MENLFEKAFEMMERVINERSVTVDTFSKEFANNSYHTDGIELHIKKGKASVKLRNQEERELTEIEYEMMFDKLFGDVEIKIPEDKQEVVNQVEACEAADLEANVIDKVEVLFGTQSIEVVQEDKTSESNLGASDLQQLSLF